MPKGKAWSFTERELLIQAYNEGKTIIELEQILQNRSKKAIYREIEKLREKGEVGYKNLLDIKRSQHKRYEIKRKEEGLKDDDWGDAEWE